MDAISTEVGLECSLIDRQAALLGRFGGTDLSRNTMAASVVRVGQAVQPTINLLRDRLLEAQLIYGDETEIQVLKEPGRKAQTKSYVSAQMTKHSGAGGTGPPIRLFAYTPSRSTEASLRLYAGAREAKRPTSQAEGDSCRPSAP